MSETTMTYRRGLRAVFAGGLTMVLLAGLGVATESAAPSHPGPMVSAASRPAGNAGERRQQVEAIADASAWNWRAAGITYVVGFHPRACCHWGVYDPRRATIYVGPSAFRNADRLRYVVLHETAHAWQYRAAGTQAVSGDYARWGHTGAKGLEVGADCIATLWGAARSQGHYWRCPDGALAVAARQLGRA
jgi:hypothetical protein